MQVAAQNPKGRVSIDDLALFVNEKRPVGISVKAHAKIGSFADDRGLQSFEVERAAIKVDIGAVGGVVDPDHGRAQTFKDLGGECAGSTVGTVDDQFLAFKGKLWKFADEVL